MKKIFRYLVLTCMFLMLVACGKKDSEKAFDEKVKEAKSQVTKNVEDGLESSKLLAKLFDKTSYKVNKVEESNEEAQLDVTIKVVNFAKYFDKITEHLQANASQEPTEEELNKIATEYLEEVLKNEKDIEFTESNIQIQMKKTDGKWEIENLDDFQMALYGGQVGSLPVQN